MRLYIDKVNPGPMVFIPLLSPSLSSFPLWIPSCFQTSPPSFSSAPLSFFGKPLHALLFPSQQAWETPTTLMGSLAYGQLHVRLVSCMEVPPSTNVMKRRKKVLPGPPSFKRGLQYSLS